MNDLSLLVEPQICDGRLGLPLNRVRVEWDSREATLSPAAAEYLEVRWDAYLKEAQARGQTLFNGAVSRLIDARYEPHTPENSPQRTLVLILGPTDYRTFLITRIRDRAWFLAHAPEVQAAALGNSVLLTQGDEALFGIRSPRVSVYAQRAHVMGGVLDSLGTGRLPASVEGLIAHLLIELHEEAAVEKDDLFQQGLWPRFIEIAQDHALAQPEAVWQWETRTPLEEIGRRLHSSEHCGWIVAHRGRMNEDLWQSMTPVARHIWQTWSASPRDSSIEKNYPS